MDIKIVFKDITKMKVDAIVNAANSDLVAGGGVCGAIFNKAGLKELSLECLKIGHCDTGKAVITSGCKLDAKYIIHAVGPIYKNGYFEEDKKLYSCYIESLKLASEYHCESIAFPLISSGIYGYPLEEAFNIAMKACKDYLKDHGIQIYFTFIDPEQFEQIKEIVSRIS